MNRDPAVVTAIAKVVGPELAEAAYDAFIEASALKWVYDLDNPECCYPLEELETMVKEEKAWGTGGLLEIGYALEYKREVIDLDLR